MTPERRTEIYNKAIETLETKGWCQGVLENADGCVCLVGALLTVIQGEVLPPNPDTAEDAEYHQIAGEIDRTLGLDDWSLVVWNDFRGRTKEEVTAMLRKAAECI